MKIALVILHADPARGGAERYTVDLAAALSQRGHEITLLASSFGPSIPNVIQQAIPANGPTRLSQYRRFVDSLEKHLAVSSYDIVHAMLPVRRCDVYHPHAGLAAEAITTGHLKHDAAIPRTLSLLANRFNRKRQHFAAVERRLLESPIPPLVLCLSNYVKATVQKHFPNFPADRLAKLFNATDLIRFDPASRPDAGRAIREKNNLAANDVVALMLAQDFARKGLKETLLALARVPAPRLKLLVAGKQDVSSYRRLADSLGISSRVRFAGPTDDPYAFYRAADFFVLPTRHDPCSLVVLEALAMGVPVISSKFNGACEIMTDGIHGFVLPDLSNLSAWAAAMAGLMNTPRRLEQSKACLQLRNSLSYQTHLDALQGLYKQVKPTQ